MLTFILFVVQEIIGIVLVLWLFAVFGLITLAAFPSLALLAVIATLMYYLFGYAHDHHGEI